MQKLVITLRLQRDGYPTSDPEQPSNAAGPAEDRLPHAFLGLRRPVSGPRPEAVGCRQRARGPSMAGRPVPPVTRARWTAATSASSATLLEVSQALAGNLNLQTGLYGVLEVLERRCGAGRGAVTLIEEASGLLVVEAALGYPRTAGRVRYRVGEGITGARGPAGHARGGAARERGARHSSTAPCPGTPRGAGGRELPLRPDPHGGLERRHARRRDAVHARARTRSG